MEHALESRQVIERIHQQYFLPESKAIDCPITVRPCIVAISRGQGRVSTRIQKTRGVAAVESLAVLGPFRPVWGGHGNGSN